jgi:hypothetical protein
VTNVIHEITLDSQEPLGGKLPPRDLGLFLAELPLAVRGSVSMALLNRSCPRGRRPDWLDRASDIRLDDYGVNGQTTLYIEAPTLGEAAGEFYAQGELFPTRPDASDTALDVFGKVLLDVARQDADSGKFDHALLKRLIRFQKVFAGPFTEARLSGRHFQNNIPRLSPPVIETARRFYDETPEPRRVRIVGVLDMVRISNQTFALRLEDGQEAPGSLVEGSIEELACHLDKPVLVFGKALFRPSGRLLRVDADGFRPATEADRYFAKLPKPLGGTRHKPSLQERKKMVEGLKAVVGKWPGDETDAEIQAALKELG